MAHGELRRKLGTISDWLHLDAKVFAVTQYAVWVPEDIDISVPSSARVYDYMLGGAHNFAVDRAMGQKLLEIDPGYRDLTRIARATLGRIVRYMVSNGIRQFLDIGSGIPTVYNVHEIAQGIDPSCRVVYVDRDPIAVAHSQLMLQDNPAAAMVSSDMREPERILNAPETQRLIDFDQPVGLLFMLMLHWLTDDDDPVRMTEFYRSKLAPGSFMGVTHVGTEHDEVTDAALATIKNNTGGEFITERTREQVAAMFGEFQLVEPGLVGCGEWRPGGPGDIASAADLNQIIYAGVGRKP
ncbi:hypothetical protein D5S17_07110 [Pseudonocardiaceae bacterium YIM PH 21723]|nr:hypothetical protein D5S17_07110 [Pseudonocardiaceae bacterium YIM PH 21723]